MEVKRALKKLQFRLQGQQNHQGQGGCPRTMQNPAE